MINESDKQIILKKLAERIGLYKCPICHSSSFSIADGYLANTLQDNLNSIQLGWLFCDIDSDKYYTWYSGIWHGLFFIPNLLRSWFGDALYKANNYSTAYNV